MAASKKTLQVSVNMLLRGGRMGQKPGVLLRQRCTSHLRRWTSRLQQHSTGLLATHSAELNEANLAFADGIDDCDLRQMDVSGRSTDGTHPMGGQFGGTGGRGVLEWRGSGWGHDARLDVMKQQRGLDRQSGSSPWLTFDRRLRCAATDISRLGITPRKSSPSVQERPQHSDTSDKDKEKIHVVFVTRDGSEKDITVPIGTNMLQAAHDNDIDLEGACEGSLACSTCHVIVEEEGLYNRLPEPTEEENDMLDLAFGLTSTSRLGCQVAAVDELDGVRLRIPASTEQGAVARLNLDPLKRPAHGRR